jgi:arylsulfatase A-like enzyme
MKLAIPLLAALGAAVGEAGAALAAAHASGAAASDAALAALVSAAVVWVVALPLAGLVAASSRIRAVKVLGASLRDGLGGGRADAPGHPLAACAVLAAASAAGAAAAFAVADALTGAMSARFAGLALACLVLGVFAVAALAGAVMTGATVPAVRRGAAHVSGAVRRAVMAVALLSAVALVVAGLRTFLPWLYVGLPAGGLLGAFAGVALGRGRMFLPVLMVGAAVAWLLSAGAVLFSPALPAPVLAIVSYRAPYASLLFGAASPLVERASPVTGADVSATGPRGAARPAHAYVPPPPRRVALPAAIPRPANLVVILVDALRPDHLGFAGYARPTSPRIDRFREGATWWKNAYTPSPSTRFAMASLFTGKDPRRTPHQDLGGNRFRLLPNARTVAEALRPVGYRRHGLTISYVKHHNLGLGQGFEHWATPWHVDDWKRTYPVAAELTSAAALTWLSGQAPGASPYLLFLHYRCTHDPYFKYPQWDFGNAPVDRYDSALRYCDQEIGRVLDAVEAREDYDRTTVVLLSDHGELFGDHGHTSHGNTLFEPDVRVLLLTRIPGVSRPTVVTPVLLTDLAPTMLELAGASPRSGMDGRSLLPHLMERPRPMGERPLFMFTDLRRGTVRYRGSAVLQWPLKLIRDERLGQVALYDVAEDPAEQKDQSLAREDDLRRLSRLLDSYDAYLAGAPPAAR